jgi:hypothetical protein
MGRRDPFWAHDRWSFGFGSHNPAWQELHDYDFEIRDYHAGSLADGYRDWREYRRQREAEGARAILPHDAAGELRRWRNWRRQRQRARRSGGPGESRHRHGRSPHDAAYGRYDRDLLAARFGGWAGVGYPDQVRDRGYAGFEGRRDYEGPHGYRRYDRDIGDGGHGGHGGGYGGPVRGRRRGPGRGRR